jgi:hypothetical protein
VCIGDRVEDIGDAEFAHGDHQPVGGLRSRELVDVCLHLFRFAAEVDGLAHEHALHPRIRDGKTNLEGSAGGKAGDAQRAREPEALVDLRVDPQLGALPQPKTGIESRVPGFAALVRVEAVGTHIGRSERRSILAHERGLPVQGEPAQVQR